MKFDTTQIAGYDNMSAEEKVMALESIEIEDNAQEIERYKNAVTKANGEAAEFKRKLNALSTDGVKKETDYKKDIEALNEKVKELERRELLASHKAKYIALGYDEDLATETAIAMADGNTELVFANQQKFIEAHDTNFRADLMKGTPVPKTGGSIGGLSVKDIMNIKDPVERQRKISENMNLFE